MIALFICPMKAPWETLGMVYVSPYTLFCEMANLFVDTGAHSTWKYICHHKIKIFGKLFDIYLAIWHCPQMENSLKPFSIITQGAYLQKETFVNIHFINTVYNSNM